MILIYTLISFLKLVIFFIWLIIVIYFCRSLFFWSLSLLLYIYKPLLLKQWGNIPIRQRILLSLFFCAFLVILFLFFKAWSRRSLSLCFFFFIPRRRLLDREWIELLYILLLVFIFRKANCEKLTEPSILFYFMQIF